MGGGIKTDARLFFVQAHSAFLQRTRPGVMPKGLERFLNRLDVNAGFDRHITMHVNFERCVVVVHDDVFLNWCPEPESNRYARYERSNGF
jgi:hypothetical protein